MKEKLNSMSEALDRTGIELDGIINSLTREDKPEPHIPTEYLKAEYVDPSRILVIPTAQEK